MDGLDLSRGCGKPCADRRPGALPSLRRHRVRDGPSRAVMVKGRGKKKETRVRPDDGRRLKATGRTAQFNVNMKPAVKAAIIKAARKAGISVTVWIEQAALAYMRHQ